jgi:hypothetical protein
MYPELASLNTNLSLAPLASAWLVEFYGGWGANTSHEGRPHLDASCAAAHPSSPAVSCWSAAANYQYISTPLYVAQNRFDSDQAGDVMGLDWWPLPENTTDRQAAQRDYKRYFGNQTMSGIVAQVLSNGKPDGLFVPSCWQHTGNLCMRPSSSKVHGVRYAESLWDWFSADSRYPHRLVDDCTGPDPCNTNCGC